MNFRMYVKTGWDGVYHVTVTEYPLSLIILAVWGMEAFGI